MPNLLKDEKAFETAIQNKNLSVVHFQADWAEQCTQVNEVLDVLSTQKDFVDVKFYSCPAEELSEVSLKYNIEAVPTVIIFKCGKKVDRINGADASKITEKIRQYTSTEYDIAEQNIPLEERLKSLINRAKVMLFMKGDRNTPRCGFSRQIIEILNNTGVPYETFDILNDEEVRQGLKTYSDWPTYPQLYVNGELIGGLDIVKEMLAAGEFASTLNA
uniref:Glutaredoxin n=1 Tax=Anoplophora glabripennis TaxID=217634 RepID=V5H0Y1_ANOGL